MQTGAVSTTVFCSKKPPRHIPKMLSKQNCDLLVFPFNGLKHIGCKFSKKNLVPWDLQELCLIAFKNDCWLPVQIFSLFFELNKMWPFHLELTGHVTPLRHIWSLHAKKCFCDTFALYLYIDVSEKPPHGSVETSKPYFSFHYQILIVKCMFCATAGFMKTQLLI